MTSFGSMDRSDAERLFNKRKALLDLGVEAKHLARCSIESSHGRQVNAMDVTDVTLGPRHREWSGFAYMFPVTAAPH